MMKKTFMTAPLLTLLLSFAAYGEALRTGPWRFELNAVYGKVPFIINIKKVRNKFEGTLKNGKETIPLNVEVKKDKIKIPLQTYEMSLEMNEPQEGAMTGFLVRHNKNPEVKTPVMAIHGIDERFPEEKSTPKIDLNGRWAVTLLDEDDKKESGILLFEQKGNNLTGSLLTPTGDYRYLEGFVSGKEFEAASFDGVYNYLIKGKVEDEKLTASLLANYKILIEGKKDAKAKLPDAYKQTQVEALAFTFPDMKGKKVSLTDKQFKNKPVIIQFFGSWCPNCLDETNYLVPWYAKNKKRGIEIVALAFERSNSPEEAKMQLLKTQKKLKINYPILIAGSTAEDKPQEKIPGIKNFISFPTTVFLNKKHEVIKVHAGFTGPSTGEFFEKWKTDFNNTVDELLKK